MRKKDLPERYFCINIKKGNGIIVYQAKSSQKQKHLSRRKIMVRVIYQILERCHNEVDPLYRQQKPFRLERKSQKQYQIKIKLFYYQ
jgi:hypothetical protein